MTPRRRDLARVALAAAALQVLPSPSRAAAPWPGRPVRLLVVYPPGGVSDAMARALAEPLSQALGVPVLVDHRPGAGGSVGIEMLARAAPDGYTIAFSAISPLTLHPLLPHSTHDPLRAVAPVAGVMNTPVLVVGTPAFRGRDFAELIALARAQPGAVRWASSGVATSGHMVLVQVRVHSGADITHVPYQGGGPQLNDALGGQFEVLSTNVAALQLKYIGAGRLKPLAVGAPVRLGVLPQVPTLAELGYPQANLASLFGIFAPAGTPAAVVQRLNAEINKATAGNRFGARLREAHNLPAGGSPEAFAQHIVQDRERNQTLVRSAGAQFD